MASNLYRLVLLLFPAEFRRRHAAAMTAQFDEQRRMTRGRPFPALALWTRAIVDAIHHGLGLRLGRGAPHHSPLPADLHQALRGLRARKGPVTTSVMLLAVTLTVAVTIFCIIDALILRPAPFPDASALVNIDAALAPKRPGQPYMPPDLARLWETRTDLFSSVGAFLQGGTALVGEGDVREQVGQVYATPGFFSTLAIPPRRGRTFAAGEGAPGLERVVVISDALWESQFARDPFVAGRTLRVNDLPMTVVGVMPASFAFPWSGIRLWRPLDLSHRSASDNIEVIARMRTDMPPALIADRVAAIAPGIMAQASPAWRYPTAAVQPLAEATLTAQTTTSIWLIAAATLLLVLTAGANLSSLTAAQISTRLRQTAIQSALGASRVRLVRQALFEQAVIGLIALAAATPATWLALSAARTLMPERLTTWSMHVAALDGRALVVLAALSLLLPIGASLVPALAGSRGSVVDLLKQDARSSTASRGAHWFRQGLVVVEVVCAVVLLVMGTLLVRSFIRLQTVDRGFDSTRVVYATWFYPARAFPSALSRRLFVDRALEAVRATPGVSAATFAFGVPPSAGILQFGKIAIDDTQTDTSLDLPGYLVSPEFFSVTGIPVVQGRAIRDGDDANSAVVSASFAAAFWPRQSAVGHRFRLSASAPWRQIVGVAGEVRSEGLDDARSPFEAYFPYPRPPIVAVSSKVVETDEAFSGNSNVIVRVADAERVLPDIRAAIQRLDSRVLVYRVARAEDLYETTLAEPRMLLVLMTVFSMAGLLVAAIGVYSVLSSIVAQQMREIGVRVMLGAEPVAMARTVFRGGLALAGVGAGVGVGVAMLCGRLVRSVLFGVSATDLVSYVVVLGVLAVATIAAAWIPARRAARVDPAELLREA